MFLKFRVSADECEMVELVETKTACVVGLYYLISNTGYTYVDVLWSDGTRDTKTASLTPLFEFTGTTIVQCQFIPLPSVRDKDTVITVPDRVDLQQTTPIEEAMDCTSYQIPRGIRIRPEEVFTTAPQPQTGTGGSFWNPWC